MPRPVAGGRRHVLVAEDNHWNQVLAVRMLGWLGCSTDVAVNGREAVEAAARRVYGAVLMDCQMPEMDGYQATAEIRRREGTAVHTPIIAMTAAASPEDRERCLAVGMDDYLAKPVILDDLKRVLVRWLPGQDGAPLGPGPAQPAHEVVDPDRLAPAWKLDPSDEDWAGSRSPQFSRLVEAFLASVPRDIARLRAAAGRKDATAMQRAAHHLKGAAVMFGLTGMAASCEALEALAVAGDFAPAGGLVHRLEEELGVARSELLPR